MQKKRLIHDWEHFRGNVGGVWEVWRADKLQNHFNVPWQEVALPHCFNAYDAVDPDQTYYQGSGWYRTKLAINNPYPNGRTLLHFEGAGQKTDVYVYTEKVASHVGGYDEFTVDITDALEKVATMDRYRDALPIAIHCDNSRDLEMIPSDVSDFNVYGGLYRYVNLIYVPSVSVDHVHIDVQEVSGGSAQVSVRTKLYAPDSGVNPLDMRVDIIGPSGDTIQTEENQVPAWSGERDILSFRLNNPLLWSTETPNLYTCRVSLQTTSGRTQVDERFGIRFFEFKKKGPFYLNGDRLLLNGTHRHDDFAGVGAALTEEMIQAEMISIKEMGANFIRLGHYQQSRIVLDLCDELGLLVWEEIPWCRGGLGGERYKQQCRDMLRNMIDQHYNHPAVILWGLGNENDWEADFETFDKNEIRAFMSELHQIAHEKDPSRLTAIRRCDFCKDIVDVYSPSIWSGWYRGIYPEYEQYTRAGHDAVDHFFHMEWGADNVAGRHMEKPYTGFEDIETGQGADERDGDYFVHGGNPRVSSYGDWSETYFCELIDWYLKSQAKMGWLTGSAQWAFKDFSTPVRPESPIPYMNLKGIVERDLTKKEAYYVFQSYWATKPMVRIYGHSNPVRWGKDGERKTIRVYSNCAEVELFVDGISVGRRRRDPEDFPCAGLRWEVELCAGNNDLRAVGIPNETGGVHDGIAVEDTLNVQYQTDEWGAPATLHMTQTQTTTGLVLIEVEAFDQNGVYCADANDFVRFGIAGEGKMLDNLGTVYGSRYVHLANGRAGIYIDPCQGRSVVSVSAERTPTVFSEVVDGDKVR